MERVQSLSLWFSADTCHGANVDRLPRQNLWAGSLDWLRKAWRWCTCHGSGWLLATYVCHAITRHQFARYSSHPCPRCDILATRASSRTQEAVTDVSSQGCQMLEIRFINRKPVGLPDLPAIGVTDTFIVDRKYICLLHRPTILFWSSYISCFLLALLSSSMTKAIIHMRKHNFWIPLPSHQSTSYSKTIITARVFNTENANTWRRAKKCLSINNRNAYLIDV